VRLAVGCPIVNLSDNFDSPLKVNQVSRFPSEPKLLRQQHYLIIIPENALLIHPIAPRLKAGLKVPYVGPNLAAYESDAWWRKASSRIHFYVALIDCRIRWPMRGSIGTVHSRLCVPVASELFILLGSQRSQCILQLC